MKTQLTKNTTVALVLGALLGLGSVGRSWSQCCLSFEGTPLTTVAVSHNVDGTFANPPSYWYITVGPGAPIPAGNYSAWCVDRGQGVLGNVFSGLLYATCDPTAIDAINNVLTAPPLGFPAVTAAVWNEVNWLLNNEQGGTAQEVQVAIWELIGQPPSGVPDPQPNPAVVAALVLSAQAHSTFTAQCGDLVGVVFASPGTQLMLLELPCTCPAVGGCRVTGGSNKEVNNSQGPCVLTPPPTFVSHGGQVGASHAGETEFTPYSACISGEWQHNRHLKGNSLVGSFHAEGNGSTHDFDSLLCACLPCDEDPSAVGLVGDVCNPNSRICGPLPSKAPANKICFSGVGDYSDTNGQKTIKAVFRVDVEDRSEGNSPSSKPPPDRYRIRIWLLGTDCRPYGPDSTDGLALRFYVSADASLIGSLATTEDLRNPIGAGAPDIDDGGDLTQGNQQIHPATGSTCP